MDQPRATDPDQMKGIKTTNKRKAVTTGASEDDVSVESDFRETLQREGVVVVHTPLAEKGLGQIQDDVRKHMLTSPEFSNAAPQDPNWTPVLGGFAAMGNPSCFHHPFARRMREMILAYLLDQDAIPIDGRFLEVLYERFMYRIPGQASSADTDMHRDEAPSARPNDLVLGGWLNMDNTSQSFSCCPRTHHMVSNNMGFAKIPKSEYNDYRLPNASRPDGWVKVEIPPGAIVIFYERLVHEVVKSKLDRVTMRMFLGFRVTDVSTPLFGIERTEKWIRDQGVPKIKSDQDPVVWPSCYSNFSRNFSKLTKWSKDTYVPACLSVSKPVSGDGPLAGTRWTRVHAKMLSLREYGLPMHPTYDIDEHAIMFPQQAWNLYTFDSPTKRVAYKGVTKSTWAAYLETRDSGLVARRPRPEAV